MIDFKTDFAVYSWIGSIVTAILSATFTIAFQTYKENKIQKEQQRAFAILFEAILNDCIIFAIQNPALSQWDNSCRVCVFAEPRHRLSPGLFFV